MTSFTRVLLLAAAAVLLYDLAVALASRPLGFDYASAVPGSYLIYAVAGFFGARAGKDVRSGMVAGAVTGLVDATLGWSLSLLIVPDLPSAGLGPPAVAVVILWVTVLAGGCGLVGGIVGRRA